MLAATISEYTMIAVFTMPEPVSNAVTMPSMEIFKVAMLKTSSTWALARIASGSQLKRSLPITRVTMRWGCGSSLTLAAPRLGRIANIAGQRAGGKNASNAHPASVKNVAFSASSRASVLMRTASATSSGVAVVSASTRCSRSLLTNDRSVQIDLRRDFVGQARVVDQLIVNAAFEQAA